MVRIIGNHYVLAVRDIAATAEYFSTVLGFREVQQVEGWRFVKRDNCMIMLGECPDALPAHDLGDHSYFGYLLVNDAAGFHAEVQGRGADIISALADKPWKMREFGVRTPDGHRLMVGQDLA